MTIDAKELIRNHGQMKSRVDVLKTQIIWVKSMEEARCMAKIEELSLAGHPMDGMPSAKRKGSRTEYAAAHFRDDVIEEMRQEGYDRIALEEELRLVEYRIKMYDAAMKALTEMEKNLIEAHYGWEMSFKQMSETNLMPNRASMYSESTLNRMHRDILCKIAAVLSQCPDVGNAMNSQKRSSLRPTPTSLTYHRTSVQ